MTKKLIICTIIFITAIIFNSRVYTFYADDWEPTSTTVTSGTDKIQNIGNKIIGPIRVLGSSVSVVTLIIVGIKYVLGSVEEKAEYKETMKPYLIGAIMVFATTNLLKILVDIIGGF